MAINGPNRTAGGGYTLPQHAFVPHPTTQLFGGMGTGLGHVAHPAVNSGMISPQHKVTAAPNVHGVQNMPTHSIIANPFGSTAR